MFIYEIGFSHQIEPAFYGYFDTFELACVFTHNRFGLELPETAFMHSDYYSVNSYYVRKIKVFCMYENGVFL